MKLYTEEQIAEAVMFGRWGGTMKKDYEEFLNKLTPIELPSDEEIGKGRDENIPIDEKDMWSERLYFNIGAKWMRDKIQGGNK